ncbi:MAG TPA: DUF4129 domain-containing protein [Gemmatimonadaceae bacterium]|jgi:hypothetical protein
MGSLDNSAIADTIAAIFRTRPFVQHNTVSIGQIIAEWVWNLIVRAIGFSVGHPAVGIVLRIAIAACLLIILARIAFGLVARYSPSRLGRQHLDVARGTDWWSTAQDLAARDDYTGAAHALYLALLGAAARRGLISLHESKTTGDYLRELRRKPGAMDLPRFTDFTRSYETVIYGVGICDRARYASLNTLANSILGAGSHARRARS